MVENQMRSGPRQAVHHPIQLRIGDIGLVGQISHQFHAQFFAQKFDIFQVHQRHSVSTVECSLVLEQL